MCIYLYEILYYILTATTESLAATVRMSAQETIAGHKVSNLDLMVSITSKPLIELAFGAAVFSPVKLDVSSNNTDASHPCRKSISTIKLENLL